MLLNYKIFIDFADKPFEDSYNLLLKEIYHILSKFHIFGTADSGGHIEKKIRRKTDQS